MYSDIQVVKYGGSSLASTEHIDFVARQIVERKQNGQGLVVVASAMGGTTDRLMSLANEVSGDPSVRELDKLLSTGETASTALLCMALQRLGHDAVSLTGGQCGILTTDEHFNAEVQRVDTRRIRDELSNGRIVVAAGFQGQNATREVTTLGLGGSDTTAVVLAAALNASRCEICSDVDGVYSADPRVVEHARLIEEISYAEMMEMARHGASVLNPHAVAHARDHGVSIYSRNTRKPDSGGTLIHDVHPEQPRVVGVASHNALLPLAVSARDDDSIAAAEKVLADLDEHDVFADHTDSDTGRRSILIPAERLPDADAFAEDLGKRFDRRIAVGDQCSSVSAIGLGVGATGDVRQTSRRHTERAGVELHNEFTGEHSVTCVVKPDHAPRLMNVLHREFDCTSEAA